MNRMNRTTYIRGFIKIFFIFFFTMYFLKARFIVALI